MFLTVLITWYLCSNQSVGLYPTNTIETNKFILNDCKANILVLDDVKMLGKVEQQRDELPYLKKIILWDEKKIVTSTLVLNWDDVMKLGAENTDSESIDERQTQMAINQCCVLSYTSGTTGNPKGRVFHKIGNRNLFLNSLINNVTIYTILVLLSSINSRCNVIPR